MLIFNLHTHVNLDYFFVFAHFSKSFYLLKHSVSGSEKSRSGDRPPKAIAILWGSGGMPHRECLVSEKTLGVF